MSYLMMTQSRKRSRNTLDEDSSDFMPLSKRINNLHINNALQTDTEWGPGPPFQYEEQPTITENVERPQYNPELDESQNPYYYNNNKLLFNLFVERMQRNGQTLN